MQKSQAALGKNKKEQGAKKNEKGAEKSKKGARMEKCKGAGAKSENVKGAGSKTPSLTEPLYDAATSDSISDEQFTDAQIYLYICRQMISDPARLNSGI